MKLGLGIIFDGKVGDGPQLAADQCSHKTPFVMPVEAGIHVSFSDAIWNVRAMDPSLRWGDAERQYQARVARLAKRC